MGRWIAALAVGLGGCLGLMLFPIAPPWVPVPQAQERVILANPSDSTSFLPLYVGIEQGLFRREGLDLKMLVMRPDLGIAGLLNGEIDFVSTIGSIARAAAGGAAVRVIGTINVRPPWHLMTRPEMKSIRELRGKTVITPDAGTSQLIWKKGFKQEGLDPSTVTFVVVGGPEMNRLTALKAGSADGVVLTAPFHAQARQMGFKELSYAGDFKGLEELPNIGLGTSVKKLRDQSQQVKRMLRGTLRSMRYTRENQGESTALIRRRFKLEPPLAQAAHEDWVKLSSVNGEVSDEGLRLTLSFAREAGAKIGEVPLSQIADLTLLREVQRELGFR